MGTLFADFAHSLRTVSRSKVASTAILLTLAVGAGTAAAATSLVNSLYFKALPYPNPGQLVAVKLEGIQRNGLRIEADPSERDREAWLAGASTLDGLAFRQDFPPRLFEGPELDRVRNSAVSPGYFEMLGVKPVLGRFFNPTDVANGAPLPIIISADFWHQRFNGLSTVIGTSVRYDSQPAQIVGVLPATFFPNVQTWTVLRYRAKMDRVRGLGATLVGRVRVGVSMQNAAADLSLVISAQPWTPGAGLKPNAFLRSLLARSTQAARPTALALGTIAVCVLLLVCANVLGLQFARLPARSTELATRMALGATSLRVARQLLAESLILSVFAGAAGALVGRALIGRFVGLLPFPLSDDSAPHADSLIILCGPLLLAIGVALVSTLLMIRPAVSGATQDLSKQRGSAATAPHSSRFGRLLVAVEAAAATVLVICAGLLIRSIDQLDRVDLGFEPSSFVALQLTPVDIAPADLPEFYGRVEQVLRAVLAVRVVGASDQVPLMGVSVKSSATAATHRDVSVSVRQILPGFFAAVGMEMLSGRDFQEGDQSGAQVNAAVINTAAAKLLFDAPSPLGSTLSVFDDKPLVVGVVNDVHAGGPAQPGEPEIYLPYRAPGTSPFPNLGLTMVIRKAPGVLLTEQQLAGAVHSTGQKVVIDTISAGSELYDDVTAVPRQRATLLSTLGVIGLILALTAVASTTARTVASRTAEIGVRIALGANPQVISWSVAREVAVPATFGIGIGVAAAFSVGKIISSFLFEVSPKDPLTIGLAAGFMLLATTAAALMPALRASSVDPVDALRVT